MSFASSIFYDDHKKHLNLWWQGVLLLSAFFAVSLLLYALDQRILADEMLWVKPAKFEVSVVTHFITLAVLASLLTPARRNGKAWAIASYAVVAAGIFEVMYIFLQAARGRESHFNTSTIAEASMYSLMGVGAVTLVLGSFCLGWLLLREYKAERDSPLVLASVLGLTIGSVLTLVIAGYLSSQMDNAISVGTENVTRVPLLGWYLDGRDMRIPHFLATHMMQLLPLYGWWLSKKAPYGHRHEAKLLGIAGAFSVLTMTLFVLAI